jgi:hypothetical protein
MNIVLRNTVSNGASMEECILLKTYPNRVDISIGNRRQDSIRLIFLDFFVDKKLPLWHKDRLWMPNRGVPRMTRPGMPGI